jgi:hypothetical protein
LDFVFVKVSQKGKKKSYFIPTYKLSLSFYVLKKFALSLLQTLFVPPHHLLGKKEEWVDKSSSLAL